MIPILIPADEVCCCGLRDWERKPGQACTVVCCASCGYVAALVTEVPR